jgi:hypothetical protein
VTPKRWQDCRAFVRDLIEREYLVEGRPVMSDGIYLYMYELWRDGARFALRAMKRKGYVSQYPKAVSTSSHRKTRRRNDAA